MSALNPNARPIYEGTESNGAFVEMPQRRMVPGYEPATEESRDLIYMRPVMGPKMWAFHVLQGPSRAFMLKETLVIRIQYGDEDVVAQHPKLPIYGYGKSLEEALQSFAEVFEVKWEHLVECDLDDLVPEAARVRAALEAIAEPM